MILLPLGLRREAPSYVPFALLLILFLHHISPIGQTRCVTSPYCQDVYCWSAERASYETK